MTGNYDDTAKEEVRMRADIAAVIGRYVKLKPSGQTLKGLCPFHKEKTPSFHVNPSRGFFHCFGCGKGGDIFRFVQEIEGVSFPEALAMLAAETGVTLKKSREQPDDIVKEGPSLSKTEMIGINTMAAEYYYGRIRSHPEAIEYFKSRGLSAETVRDFKLGYAPPGWSSLISFAEGKGVAADALVACGCAVRKEDGAVYDRFRERVMFPLVDLSGRIIGFAGRGLDKDATPKYLNSPETALYRKKEFLYGLNSTRQYIKDERVVLVVEGYMDFLMLFQSGIRNAVATSGTAMTPEHANIIKRFAPRAVLVFDGDEAGQAAAQRGVYTLAPFDLDVSILVLPPEEDPDSFVRKSGPDAFRVLIAGAVPANEFVIDKAIAQHGGRTPRGQRAVIEQMAPLLHSMSDALARARFKKDLAERLGADEKTVYQMLHRPSDVKGRAGGVPERDDEAYLRSLEGSFLHLLFTQPEGIAEARQYIAADTLTDGISGDIYSFMLEIFDKQGSLDGILDRIGDGEMRSVVSRMLVQPACKQNVREELEQKIIHLRRKYLKSLVRRSRILLKSEKDVFRRAELLRRISDDTRQLNELGEGT
ncbi:MAG: DNA primase [Chitinispirillaceae bacterium]|nr:DNA primase [Chitinispirillaceae bacterium]